MVLTCIFSPIQWTVYSKVANCLRWKVLEFDWQPQHFSSEIIPLSKIGYGQYICNYKCFPVDFRQAQFYNWIFVWLCTSSVNLSIHDICIDTVPQYFVMVLLLMLLVTVLSLYHRALVTFYMKLSRNVRKCFEFSLQWLITWHRVKCQATFEHNQNHLPVRPCITPYLHSCLHHINRSITKYTSCSSRSASTECLYHSYVFTIVTTL